MALGCKCNSGLSNTGQPNCITLQSVTSRLILVPLKDATGALNKVSLTTNPTWASLFTELDATKRWYPLPVFENVEMAKADSTFEEAPSGRKVFIKSGKRSFAGELWSQTPTFLAKLQSNRCSDFGFYIVDVNGSLVGSKVGTDLYPIPVDNESFEAKLMFATDSSIQKIMLSFDWYRLFDESTLWLVTQSDANFDFNNVDGLLDVNLTKVSSTATSIVVTAKLDYGSGANQIAVKGLVLANFALTNGTTGAVIAISAVAESTAVEGQYTLTIANTPLLTPIKLKVLSTSNYEGELSTPL
jgi:hypothetical protein